MKRVTITALIPDWADAEEVADNVCEYMDMSDYLAAGAIVDITEISEQQAVEQFGYDPGGDDDDTGEEAPNDGPADRVDSLTERK
jgi:hypothetical protein